MIVWRADGAFLRGVSWMGGNVGKVIPVSLYQCWHTKAGSAVNPGHQDPETHHKLVVGAEALEGGTGSTNRPVSLPVVFGNATFVEFWLHFLRGMAAD
jgi:hypothetical protein